ncbi:MAG TPA: nucleotidyltransferase family protein [Pyrinomonadaceae bacterium]
MKHRPENELILSIARREIDREEVRALAQRQLDFNYLFVTAQAHGLLPLFQKHLTTAASEMIPGHFLSQLKRASVANSQNVLHLIGKQLRIYKLFKENGIPVAIFKGPLLAWIAYGEISLRQAGDIDVLISRQHFNQAITLLESLGYQMTPKLTPAQLASHFANHCEIQFMRDDWFTILDLHWDLKPPSFVFKLSADDVMARLQSVSLAGTQVETFGPEDLVLYQAMHGAKHLWRRLEWITSMAESLRAMPEVNWDTIVARAESAHGTRIVGLGLRLVEQFSNLQLPSGVLAALDFGGAMRQMATRIREQIFSTSGPADSTDTNLYNLRVMDRKRDAMLAALHALFVPTLADWQALALPAPLHPLYYAFRPLRLSKVYSTTLWQRLRRVGEKENV